LGGSIILAPPYRNGSEKILVGKGKGGERRGACGYEKRATWASMSENCDGTSRCP